MYMEENKIYLLNQIDLNKIIYSKVNEMNEKKLINKGTFKLQSYNGKINSLKY